MLGSFVVLVAKVVVLFPSAGMEGVKNSALSHGWKTQITLLLLSVSSFGIDKEKHQVRVRG